MLGVAVSFSQSDVVRGPILGFAPNSAGSVIWPIVGVAGASILGEPLLLDSEVYGASVSPKNDYALAIRREDVGNLSVGAIADVAIFSLRKGKFGFIDSSGFRMDGDQKLECELTVREGKVVYDLNGISRPLWNKP